MRLPVFKQAKKSESLKHALNKARELHNKKLFPERQMYCPYCGQPLVETSRMERLETLDEHVSNPNGTPSYKTVYKCCCKDSRYTMWNYMGESYYDFPDDYTDLCKEDKDRMWDERERYDHFGKDEYNREAWSKDAINSISFHSHNDVYNPGKKKRFEFKFWKNQKYIPCIVWHYKYDSFGKVISCHPMLEYHIRDDKYTTQYGEIHYTYVIEPSIYHQLDRRFRATKSDWKKYKANPSERNLKRLYGYSYGNPHWRKGIWKFWYTKVVPFYFGKIKGIKYEPKED